MQDSYGIGDDLIKELYRHGDDADIFLILNKIYIRRNHIVCILVQDGGQVKITDGIKLFTIKPSINQFKRLWMFYYPRTRNILEDDLKYPYIRNLINQWAR